MMTYTGTSSKNNKEYSIKGVSERYLPAVLYSLFNGCDILEVSEDGKILDKQRLDTYFDEPR